LKGWTYSLKSFLVASWKSFFQGGVLEDSIFPEFKISSLFQKTVRTIDFTKVFNKPFQQGNAFSGVGVASFVQQ